MLKEMPPHESLIEAARDYPELEPLSFTVYLHLLRAGDDSSRVADSYLQRHGISQGRFAIMVFLLRADGKGGMISWKRTPAELAALTCVSRATITGLVDSLERDALVIRTPDMRDRRMLFVSLTQKGIDFTRKLLPEYFQRAVSMTATLTETERRTLIKLLTKVSEQANLVEPTSYTGRTYGLG